MLELQMLKQLPARALAQTLSQIKAVMEAVKMENQQRKCTSLKQFDIGVQYMSILKRK